MLINTVLLFLQDALPIFILLALLLLIQHRLTADNKWIIQGVTISTLCVFFLSTNIGDIGQYFDGAGIEVIFSLGDLLIYCCIVFIFIIDGHQNIRIENSNKWRTAFVLSFSLIITFNSVNFLIYLSSYNIQTGGVEPLVVGVILASGICISIAILLYLALLHSDNNSDTGISRFFLLFFGVGQLMNMSHLLEQVDMFPSDTPLWNSNVLISENSEIGQLFMALFGYDATPSALQVVLYMSAVALPLLIAFAFGSFYKIEHKTTTCLSNHPLSGQISSEQNHHQSNQQKGENV